MQLSFQVRNGGAAVCRCLPGFNHLPGQSTIDGCPTRDSGSSNTRQSTSNSVRFQSQRPSNNRNRFSNNNRNTIISAGDPCQPPPCGTNAECSVVGNRAVSVP